MSAPFTLLDAAGASRTPAAWDAAVLILIDHQREYIDGKLPLTGMPEAVAACADLLARARAHGTPVIHVVHHGKAGGAFDPAGPYAGIIEGLEPAPGEETVVKQLPNSFAGTELDARLAALGSKDLIVAKRSFSAASVTRCSSAAASGSPPSGSGRSRVAQALATSVTR